jgi:hypothetical protein
MESLWKETGLYEVAWVVPGEGGMYRRFSNLREDQFDVRGRPAEISKLLAG